MNLFGLMCGIAGRLFPLAAAFLCMTIAESMAIDHAPINAVIVGKQRRLANAEKSPSNTESTNLPAIPLRLPH